MKKMLFCISAVLIVCGFAGCRSGAVGDSQKDQPRIAEIKADEIAKVELQGRRTGDELLKALQTGNFALTSTLAVGDGKNKLTEERFGKLLKNLQKIGGIKGFEYLGALIMKPYRRLLWKVSFKGKAPAAAEADMLFELLIGHVNGEYRTVGFGFRP